MRNEKQEQMNVLRNVFLSVLLISVLSVTAFSLQTIYSNGVSVETVKSYGIFQNGVYQDTRDVPVPSPYSVKKTEVVVKNGENVARNISISLDYMGAIEMIDPPAKGNASSIVWEATLLPYEEKAFSVFGRGLETGTASVSVSEALPQAVNKTLVVDNLSNKSRKPPATFGYTREEEIVDVLQPVFAEQRNLDVVARSLIVILAGMVLLTVASGFAYIFGAEERPKMHRRAKIHIGDFYHADEKADMLAKYKYEETAYWEGKEK